MKNFNILVNDDIKLASTIPGKFYGDSQVYEACKEKIFARSWQFIADTDVVKTPGQVYPFVYLDGVVDEPLLFTRDLNDKLHCISNACTHRGAIVEEHPCQRKSLRCRYHGRKFSLDGSFVSMPEFEQARDFPCDKDNLTQIPFDTFGNFLFVSLKPSYKLKDLFSDVASRLSWFPYDQLVFDSSLSRDYLVKANWMLYCDNYLEGFHIPFVHPGLNSEVDYGAYRTELFEYSNLQVGIASGGDHTFDLPSNSPDYGQEVAAYYYWLFPNLMFNFYPWGLSINVVRPLEPKLTKVSFLSYVWQRDKLGTGAGAELDKVEREDEDIVESVQLGVSSRYYTSGRFSPTRESGVHHFHKLLEKHLSHE